jgi:hypothetical protein
MKKITATVLTLFLSLAGFAGTGNESSVHTAGNSATASPFQDDTQARDMYIAYASDSAKPPKKRRGRPGAKVRIELLRDGVKQFVPIHTTFRAGDKVKFHFAVNFPAHVSVINLGSSGRLSQLFPYSGAPELVGITKNYTVPHRNDLWFEFDDKSGEEKLTFIFSQARFLPANTSPVQGQPASSSASSGSITVNPPGDQQAALNDLNSRALDNGKDLNLVQVANDEGYVLCDEQQLRKPVGFRISLKHR